LVAALEPLIQTGAVEEVLASGAALIRHPAVGTNDAVTDSTLALSLHRTNNIAPESRKAVHDASALERC
jgi:hypothetical protein